MSFESVFSRERPKANLEKKDFEVMLAEIAGQLSKDPSSDNEFIQKRLQELVPASPSQGGRIAHAFGDSMHEGFIPPDMEITRSFLVDPLKIDDPEIYKTFLDTLRQFHATEGWKDKPLRSYYLNALQHAVGNYFGNFVGDAWTENNNRELYMDHVGAESQAISLSQFRGKGIAVCAEKGPTAQNLLAFAGAESRLLVSDCRTPSDRESATAHYYILLKSAKGNFIYDPTNPSILTDREGKLVSASPAVHPISPGQCQSLLAGGEVEVVHTDGKRLEDGQIMKEEAQWTYVGIKQHTA